MGSTPASVNPEQKDFVSDQSDLSKLVDIWTSCLEPMIQFQKKSALAQTIQNDKLGRIKDSVGKLSQVCKDSHEKEGKGRSGKGQKTKEDPNEQVRANLIEELSQQIDHVELMHQETVKH